LGSILGETRMPGGTMFPEFYNELGAMPGTIMVFPRGFPPPAGGPATFLSRSRALGPGKLHTTTIQLRAKGLTFMRFPFFVWAQFVTAFLLLLAFPPLEAAGVMQLMDRVAGTNFFLPSGLVVSGQALTNVGGGNPLLDRKS